jgi:hypothetical protein
MSAPSESLFGVGGDVVTKKRNRLVGSTVRFIVSLKAWGILTDKSVEEDS